MLKKIGTASVLSAAILFGGVFTSSAASVSDQSPNLLYNKVHTYYFLNGKWHEETGSHLSDLFKNCFPGLDIKWDFNNDKNENVEKPNNDKVEESPQQPETDTPEEKPEEEQPQTPVENTDKEEVEKPVEKPEAQQPNQEEPQQEQEQPNQESTSQLSQYEQEVVELTNNERAKYGLSPLEIDTELSRVAKEKSNDMAKNGYFDHNSPVYGSPFDMMQSYGISYRTAGENIAKGQRTPQEVVNAWMNSEGHRANILNGDYTHIGVGFVEQGNHWTQQFIGK